jgi:hypothetical protein
MVRVLLWAGGEHFSSVAVSLPPHRSAALKQRPQWFGLFHWWAVSMYPAWHILCRRAVARY